MDKRYIIKKDEEKDVVTYMEYEKREGLSMKPKHKVTFEDMINVSEIVIVNPTLIQKLISKKCSKNMKRIFDMYMTIIDEEDGSGHGTVLNEISRLESLIQNKYKKYMEEKEYELTLRKLELLKDEITSRKRALEEEVYSKKGSSR